MTKSTSQELAIICAQGAYDIKAENIRILDLRGLSSITDFMVICTATSIPHLRAIIRDVDGYVMDNAHARHTYKEGTSQSLWGVLDYINVMVHIMTEETREFYNLEELWKDAPELAWEPTHA